MSNNVEFIPVTVKQVEFIATLTKQRNCLAIEAEVDAARAKVMTRTFSKGEASKLIGRLLEQPRKVLEAGQVAGSTFGPTYRAAEAAAEPSDGIYIIRGNGQFYSEAEIFKVYKMVHGSGRQGVKRLVMGDDKSGRFEYMGLAAKHLPQQAERMTLEEAKTFGALYGFCVRCGKTLTDEGSIAAGIGPVCAGKDGWGEAPAVDPDSCTPGQKCGDINSLCSKHQQRYQAKYGRASNE